MSKKWKIGTLLGIFTLTCGLYTWGIPAAINIEKHKPQIEQTVFENYGYKIDLGNPKISMGWFPSVWVKSNNFAIINSDNSKALSIDNPKIKLKLFPLLFKKIEISKLSATKEEAHFLYNENSQFMLGDYPLHFEKQNKKFTLTKMVMDLGEYNIYLNDKKNNQQLSLCGNYFELGEYIHNKNLNFGTKGVFNVGEKSTEIYADVDINLPINNLSEDKLKIEANINNFDLSSISEYINSISKGKIKALRGIVSFNAQTLPDKFGHKKIATSFITNDFAIIGEDKANSITYDKDLKINVNFDTVENGINFENTTIKSDKIDFTVNGKVFDIGNKKPKYNIEAEVKNTRLEDVVSILPPSEKIFTDFNLLKLKKYVIYGDGNAKLKFHGQGRYPHINGFVKLRDTYLIHPIKNSPANVSVDLNFSDQVMLIDVFAPTSKNQHIIVKGKAIIDGSKYSELQVKSTDAIMLAPAQEVLNPLHEILKFQLGPVPMMEISGLGNVDIHSAGKKIDPHIWGQINFSNATASFNDVHNLVLHNGSGEVKFDDTKVTFKTHTATINNKPVRIWGDCVMLGKLNVYVKANNQNIPQLIKTIRTSPILEEVQRVIKPFQNPDGIADVFLHIYGNATNAETAVFNEDLFAKGTITLHNAKTVLQNTFLPFKNINGIVNFDVKDSDYNLTGFVRNSKVHVNGTGSNSEIDLVAHSDKFMIKDISDLFDPNSKLPYKDELGKLYASFDAWYKGIADGENIDYDKIIANGKFIPNMSTNLPIRLNGGDFTIRNSQFKTSTLSGLFFNNPYTLSLTAKDIYDENTLKISDAIFNFENFDISAIDTLKNQIKLTKEMEYILDNIEKIKGQTNISGSIKNNAINASANLQDTEFVFKPCKALVQILNGYAKIQNNVLYLDKINSRVSSMPVFVNGNITDYDTNPNLNLAISAKLSQQFFDRFYNAKTVYPVKAKGDINFHTKLNGKLNALSNKSTLNIGENSSIYYMGATIAGAPTGTYNTEGMTTNPVSITADTILYPDKIKLNSVNYNQIITSQNKKKSEQNQINASGEISLMENNVLGFKNLKIKTTNPTNARIFNVLFKKPTIKQGVFSTDLLINGTSLTPYVIGFLNISSIDIPLLDATIRDINFDFQKDYINVTSKGVVLTNDITIESKIANNAKLPLEIENANIQMDQLNLNVISEALNDFDADNTRNPMKTDTLPMLEPDMIIIKNAQINADNVVIKKAQATNFKSNITLDKDQILRINDYSFNIANGIVKGLITYDLKTFKTTGEMHIKDADAQIISENFFDMPGQMFGTVTGDLQAECKGLSSVECINTLSGEGEFTVTEGKMPKLGSLEYLLKAGNLITGGVTGLSINGIIDLITPLKTGNFKSISGQIKVKDGIAHDINVYSSGDDLNMYLTGSYNIASLVADMEVYGSLSKNFSTLLGKIGNSSLNTLFNTIPGIKINEINPKSTSNIHKIPNFDKSNTLRVFKSEIYGDINGSNYVKSFRWIKD